MTRKKIDKEELILKAEGEELKNLVASPGWKTAKSILLKEIAVLDSITSIPISLKPEEKLHEIEIRNGAINIVLKWIQNVEGGAEQYSVQQEALAQEKENDFVRVYGE